MTSSVVSRRAEVPVLSIAAGALSVQVPGSAPAKSEARSAGLAPWALHSVGGELEPDGQSEGEES